MYSMGEFLIIAQPPPHCRIGIELIFTTINSSKSNPQPHNIPTRFNDNVSKSQKNREYLSIHATTRFMGAAIFLFRWRTLVDISESKTEPAAWCMIKPGTTGYL